MSKTGKSTEFSESSNWSEYTTLSPDIDSSSTCPDDPQHAVWHLVPAGVSHRSQVHVRVSHTLKTADVVVCSNRCPSSYKRERTGQIIHTENSRKCVGAPMWNGYADQRRRGARMRGDARGQVG